MKGELAATHKKEAQKISIEIIRKGLVNLIYLFSIPKVNLKNNKFMELFHKTIWSYYKD